MASRLDELRNSVVDSSKDAAGVIANAIPGELEDLIDSLDGDRPIIGELGDDYLVGTNGSDVILADPTVADDVGGDDVVDGRKGDDTIYTFGGKDIVFGGKGNDVIQTADGDDGVDAGPGNDDVQSGRGQDIVLGGIGKDLLRGGEGDDWLDGGDGNDRVVGGSDDDVLIDGLGADRLEGRSGNDTIILVADATTDRVQIRDEDVGEGVDLVRGFDTSASERGGDVLDLRDIAESSFLAAEDGDDVLLFADRGAETGPVLMARVEAADLDDLLDDNILTPEGVTVTPTTLDALNVEALVPLDPSAIA
jgi:Ca2+-binding RTX toxin-like protein